jgi:uridine phosphorylase
VELAVSEASEVLELVGVTAFVRVGLSVGALVSDSDGELVIEGVSEIELESEGGLVGESEIESEIDAVSLSDCETDIVTDAEADATEVCDDDSEGDTDFVDVSVELAVSEASEVLELLREAALVRV